MNTRPFLFRETANRYNLIVGLQFRRDAGQVLLMNLVEATVGSTYNNQQNEQNNNQHKSHVSATIAHNSPPPFYDLLQIM